MSTEPDVSIGSFSPVAFDTQTRRPEPGIALCLSGGGYRAMLFHLGALVRLNDAGWLKRTARVSSVSGGSITAAVLAAAWKRLAFDSAGVALSFSSEVTEPLRSFASETIDRSAVVAGLAKRWLGPGYAAQRLARIYRKRLFGDLTLQDLPDDSQGEGPRFVFNATSLQTGSLWRFSRPYARDWRVGRIDNPTIALADVVAASSAFPPILSPRILKLPIGTIHPESNAAHAALAQPPYTTRLFLTDGGVYDNLGLETGWKRFQTILVSDAGGAMQLEPTPHTDLLLQTRHVLDLMDNQVRNLRKRQVISSLKLGWVDTFPWGGRDGAYWGIRTNIANYQLTDTLSAPHQQTLALAKVPTRLAKMDRSTQNHLINWGYGVCDAAMRKHVANFPTAPPSQYPCDGGVG